MASPTNNLGHSHSRTSATPESVTETLQVPESPNEKPTGAEGPKGIQAVKKGRDFWLSFLAMIVSIFLSALDLTSVGTALPTIADALNDTEGNYVWVRRLWYRPVSSSCTDYCQGWICICAVEYRNHAFERQSVRCLWKARVLTFGPLRALTYVVSSPQKASHVGLDCPLRTWERLGRRCPRYGSCPTWCLLTNV